MSRGQVVYGKASIGWSWLAGFALLALFLEACFPRPADKWSRPSNVGRCGEPYLPNLQLPRMVLHLDLACAPAREGKREKNDKLAERDRERQTDRDRRRQRGGG